MARVVTPRSLLALHVPVHIALLKDNDGSNDDIIFIIIPN